MILRHIFEKYRWIDVRLNYHYPSERVLISSSFHIYFVLRGKTKNQHTVIQYAFIIPFSNLNLFSRAAFNQPKKRSFVSYIAVRRVLRVVELHRSATLPVVLQRCTTQTATSECYAPYRYVKELRHVSVYSHFLANTRIMLHP